MKKIPNLKKIKKNNRIFYAPNQNEKIIYKGIKIEIEKKYGITNTHRDIIIKQLISTLTHGNSTISQNIWTHDLPKINLIIIRTDIQNFFPNLNKHLLYKKLMRSPILSDKSLKVIKEFIFSSRVKGLPLGIPFSNALAEIYLEEFDNDVLLNFNPTFYFRYVDDILILKYDSLEGDNLTVYPKILNKLFNKNSLKINSEKTKILHYDISKNPNESFDYLGYNFTLGKKNKLIIKISDSKNQKILNNIHKIFRLYYQSNKSRKQLWILYYRLLNTLYGITSFDSNGNKIKFGLGYNYKYINNSQQIDFIVKKIKTLCYSNRLPTEFRNKIFKLLSYKYSPLEILNKKYNYTKITQGTLNEICKRLHLTFPNQNIKSIFYEIYRDF